MSRTTKTITLISLYVPDTDHQPTNCANSAQTDSVRLHGPAQNKHLMRSILGEIFYQTILQQFMLICLTIYCLAFILISL